MSIAPAVVHFNGDEDQGAPIRRGDTFSHPFTFVDGAGNPINKSGSDWSAQIRGLPGDGPVVASMTVGVVVNVVTVSLTPAETAQLAPGLYGWDIQEDDGVAVVTRLAGEAVVSQDFARP